MISIPTPTGCTSQRVRDLWTIVTFRTDFSESQQGWFVRKLLVQAQLPFSWYQHTTQLPALADTTCEAVITLPRLLPDLGPSPLLTIA